MTRKCIVFRVLPLRLRREDLNMIKHTNMDICSVTAALANAKLGDQFMV